MAPAAVGTWPKVCASAQISMKVERYAFDDTKRSNCKAVKNEASIALIVLVESTASLFLQTHPQAIVNAAFFNGSSSHTF